MKKFLFIAILANLFYSCQNLGTNQNTIPKANLLVQEDFILNDSGVTYVLDIVNENVKNKTTRSYLQGNESEIYLGEFITFPVIADQFSLVSSPKSNYYDAFIKNGYFYFRSLYQGEYIFSLKKDGLVLENIKIENISRFKISSSSLKNIIIENNNIKDLERLKNSATLFKMLFPNNDLNKDFSLMLLKLSGSTGNKNIFQSQEKYLESNFKLDSLEKLTILSIKENLFSNNYTLTKSYLDFNSNSYELNDFVKKNIIKRNSKNSDELLFLEACYTQERTKDLADMISKLYFMSGNISKGTYYSTKNSSILPVPMTNVFEEMTKEKNEVSSVENDIDKLLNGGINYYKNNSLAEAIVILEKAKILAGDSEKINDINFHLGNSYYSNKNLDKAKENFEAITDSTVNFYPEVIYKLGDIAFLQGNKEKASEYFNTAKKNFSSTVWGRKSNIYLLKIK